MWLNDLCSRWLGRAVTNRKSSQHAGRKPRTRLRLELLEDRNLPSNFSAATVSDLIADINASNQQGGANTITLVAPTASPYVLMTVDNTTDVVGGGGNYLPVIAANDNLTIVGNGDTIQGGAPSSSYGARALDVAAGASLTLQNLTLQALGYAAWGVIGNGGAIYNHGTLDLNAVTVQHCYVTIDGAAIYNQGTAVLNSVTVQADSAEYGSGGAIYNQGTLSLNSVTVQGNYGGGIYNQGSLSFSVVTVSGNSGAGGIYNSGSADLNNVTVQGNSYKFGAGGGIYSSGSLTLEGGTKIEGNSATRGGGLYVAGGTATVINTTFSSNTAVGQNGYSFYRETFRGEVLVHVQPRDGRGGAMYVAGGSVTVTSTTFSSNTATVGPNNPYYDVSGLANALGGALYAAGGNVTLGNDIVTGNSALSGYGLMGEGGGLYITPAALVYIDAFTLAHITNNTASSGYPNIYGAYTISSTARVPC
jgi:hypothetical protein